MVLQTKIILHFIFQVEACLKKALLDRKIVTIECEREVVQIIEESEVDIEADPLLERACALDLLKHCKDLEHGAGRRKALSSFI